MIPLLPLLLFLVPNKTHAFQSRNAIGLSSRHSVLPIAKIVSPRMIPLFDRPPQKQQEEPPSSGFADVPPVDPSVLIAAQDEQSQRVAISAIAAGLFLGTVLVVNALTLVEDILPIGWFDAWRDFTWPIPLGLIYTAAGVAHFTMQESFVPMVPPVGSFGGLWQVPAPQAERFNLSYAEYHTAWSGVAEMGGGLLLVLAGLGVGLPVPIPAFLLFLLTLVITPANVYMFTNDVRPPGMPPIPYPEGHAFRAVLQCVLLGLFWKLTFQ